MARGASARGPDTTGFAPAPCVVVDANRAYNGGGSAGVVGARGEGAETVCGAEEEEGEAGAGAGEGEEVDVVRFRRRCFIGPCFRVSVSPCFCFSVVVGRASSVRERIVRDESDGLKIED